MMKNFDYQDMVKIKKLLKTDCVRLGVKEEFGMDVFQTSFFCNGEQFGLVDRNNQKILLELLGNELIFMRCVGENQLKVVRIEAGADKRKFGVIRDTLEVRLGGLIFTELWKNYVFLNDRCELVDLDEREFVLSKDLVADYLEKLDRNTASFRKIYSKVLDYLRLDTNMVSYENRFQVNLNHDEGVLSVIFNGEDITSVYAELNGKFLVKRIYDLYRGMITKENERDVYLIYLNRLRDEVFGFRELRGIPFVIDRLIGKSFRNVLRKSIYYENSFLRDYFVNCCMDEFHREDILAGIKNAYDTWNDSLYLEVNGKREVNQNKGVKKRLFRGKKKNLNLKN